MPNFDERFKENLFILFELISERDFAIIFTSSDEASGKISRFTISSISGLYQPTFYYEKINENYPIRSEKDLHKCFHIRSFSDFQLLGLDNTQIMISHDWPSGIPVKYGGSYLQTRKGTLIESDKKHTFGLDKGLKIIEKLKPHVWFASHHHIFFNTDVEGTSFYAFPKTTTKHWFDIFEVESNDQIYPFKYRGEWLSILKATSLEMENPEVLKNVNWDERWKTYKSKLEKIDDCPVGLLELNPYEYTAKFCTDHNIYCPNKEIRDYMDKKRNNITNIQQRGEEVNSLASSNTNQKVQSPTTVNINQEVQFLRDMLEVKSNEINLLREEIEKLKSSLNELKDNYITVMEKMNDLNNKK